MVTDLNLTQQKPSTFKHDTSHCAPQERVNELMEATQTLCRLGINIVKPINELQHYEVAKRHGRTVTGASSSASGKKYTAVLNSTSRKNTGFAMPDFGRDKGPLAGQTFIKETAKEVFAAVRENLELFTPAEHAAPDLNLSDDDNRRFGERIKNTATVLRFFKEMAELEDKKLVHSIPGMKALLSQESAIGR